MSPAVRRGFNKQIFGADEQVPIPTFRLVGRLQSTETSQSLLALSEDELRHATKSPSQVLQNSLSRRYA
jgi:hypothetical protein